MTRRLGVPLIRLGRVGSTMDELAALVERGADEGTAVLAEEQTAGRGRAGRVWLSEPGTAILLSLLLRPTVSPDRLSVLPLVVGQAVAEAVEAETGLSPRLKWPNDLLLNDLKVAGILTTARADGATPRVIVGIGLNVNATRAQLPEGATSLAAEVGTPVDRERVLAAMLDRLDGAYREFQQTGGAFDRDTWQARAAYLGERVKIETMSGVDEGVLAGVDPDGALVLVDRQGERRRFVNGDVRRGPRRLATGRG